MTTSTQVRDESVMRAVARGDYQQAIAYKLQCVRECVPEDVDERDFEVASRHGVGARRWFAYYETSRDADLPRAGEVLDRLDQITAGSLP